MKYILSTLIVAVLVLIGYQLFFVTNDTEGEVTATAPEFTSDVFTFYCPNELTTTIQYADSADFAQLSVSGMQYTLERAKSASGARYTNTESGIEFWEHQGEASITFPDTGTLQCQSTPTAETASNLIHVIFPTAGDTIGNPVIVSGEARGYWFFEGSAPVVVTNWDGLIIGEGYITADGEWMTEDFVPFTGTISYNLPAESYNTSGAVIFRRDNPSGLPENDAAVEIPVTLTL